jgi:DNA mismatch endonuclease, patch repair protein
MSRIRGRNTTLELRVRRGLHARGFRFRLHAKNLPGRPDVVLPRRQTGIFVHGCFWHGHDCHLAKMPATRPEFWQSKIDGTVARDHAAVVALHAAGWRVLIIWECALRGPTRLPEEQVMEEASGFLKREEGNMREIRGNTTTPCGIGSDG